MLSVDACKILLLYTWIFRIALLAVARGSATLRHSGAHCVDRGQSRHQRQSRGAWIFSWSFGVVRGHYVYTVLICTCTIGIYMDYMARIIVRCCVKATSSITTQHSDASDKRNGGISSGGRGGPCSRFVGLSRPTRG